MDVRGISLAQRPVKLHRVTGGVRVHTDVRYTLPGHSRVKEGRPRPTHFSEPIPAHRSTRRLSVGIGPVGTPRYLPGTAAYRLGPPRSTVHAHIHTHTPTTDWRVDTPTGTGHHGTPHERTNTSLTGSPRPARWPTIELTCLPDRMPLLAASACRARAQLKLPPALSMECIDEGRRMVAIVGLGAKPHARTAAASPPLLPATTA